MRWEKIVNLHKRRVSDYNKLQLKLMGRQIYVLWVKENHRKKSPFG